MINIYLASMSETTRTQKNASFPAEKCLEPSYHAYEAWGTRALECHFRGESQAKALGP